MQLIPTIQKKQIKEEINNLFPKKNLLNTFDLNKIVEAQKQAIANGDLIINDKTIEANYENHTIYTDSLNRVIVPIHYENTIISNLHEMLLHAGETKMFNAIKNYIYIPNIKRKLNSFIKVCSTCQKTKDTNPKSGELHGFIG